MPVPRLQQRLGLHQAGPPQLDPGRDASPVGAPADQVARPHEVLDRLRSVEAERFECAAAEHADSNVSRSSKSTPWRSAAVSAGDRTSGRTAWCRNSARTRSTMRSVMSGSSLHSAMTRLPAPAAQHVEREPSPIDAAEALRRLDHLGIVVERGHVDAFGDQALGDDLRKRPKPTSRMEPRTPSISSGARAGRAGRAAPR